MGCVSKLTHKPSIPLTKSTRCSCSSACHASKGISVLLLAFCSKLKGAIREHRWFTGEGGEKMKITKLKSFNWNVVIKFLIKKEKVCCEAEKKKMSFGCLESALLHTKSVCPLSNCGETKSRAATAIWWKTCPLQWHLLKVYSQTQEETIHLETAFVLSGGHGNPRCSFWKGQWKLFLSDQ